MPFETRCLLRVDERSDQKQSKRRFYCCHLRANGGELGKLAAVFAKGNTPQLGQIVEAVGTVAMRNGENVPIAHMIVTRWIELKLPEVLPAKPAKLVDDALTLGDP
jgi:hypothetical protein